MFKNLVEMIEFRQQSETRGITFIEGEEKEIFVSYKNLYQKSLEILYNLQLKGIPSGAEIVFQIEDNLNYIIFFWACILGGFIPVPLSVSANDEHKLKLFKIWGILKRPYLITNTKELLALERTAVEKGLVNEIEKIKSNTILIEDLNIISKVGRVVVPDSNEIAFIQFSSGTTGDPKGVVLTHENLMTNLKAIVRCSNITHQDSMLSWMPLTHDMGLIGFHIVPLYADIDLYNIPTTLFIRRPLLWWTKVNEHKATLLSSPNFGYQYFLSYFKPENAKNWDLSGVRLIYNGAEPISSELCREFLDEMVKFGLQRNTMYPVYGMAEASLAVTFPSPGKEMAVINLNRNFLGVGERVEEVAAHHINRVSFVEVGYPIDDCSVRICDQHHQELAEGVIGYIQIKGKNVTSGYYNSPKANAELITEDGWLQTGDLGFWRNHRLIITGRAKDIIFVNGQNYYAQDIERIAESLDGIKPGGVVAFSELNVEQQKEDIILLVLFKKEMAQFIPLVINLKKHFNKSLGLEIKHVIPVKKIPKTTSGKIKRYQLRQMHGAGSFLKITAEIERLIQETEVVAKDNQPKNQTEAKLLTLWSGLLGNEKIGLHDNFGEIGGNSIVLTKFCNLIEQENLGNISLVELFAYPTIAKLAEYIDHRNNNKFCETSLFRLRLPAEYFFDEFQDLTKTPEDFLYRYEINEEDLRLLRIIARVENVELNDILLALYGYLLADISGQEEISIQIMDGAKRQAFSLSIDLRHLKSIAELFQQMNEKRRQSEKFLYKIQDINKITIPKEPFSIIPFFYDEKMLTGTLRLVEIYDLCLGVSETDSRLSLLFEFNNDRIDIDKGEALAIRYMKLLYATLNKFKTDLKEIAG